MNLLIYFCIPLVLASSDRVTRGTYGRESDENEQTTDLGIGATRDNPEETSETVESYANFYPGHIDYGNPELKEFAVDIQDGTYYRKGLAAEAQAGMLRNPTFLMNGLVRTQSHPSADHPSHIPTDIYNSIRDKKLRTPVPVAETPQQAVPGPSYGFRSPSTSFDPIHGTLLGAQQYDYGKLSPVSNVEHLYNYPQQQSPFLSLGSGPQTPTGYQHPGLDPYYSRQLSHQNVFNPFYPAHYPQSGPVEEQLPLAQHVVPTLQAPNVVVPQQQPLTFTSLDPVVPAFQQPTTLIKIPRLQQPGIPVYAPFLNSAQPQPVLYYQPQPQAPIPLLQFVPQQPLLESGGVAPIQPQYLTAPHPHIHLQPVQKLDEPHVPAVTLLKNEAGVEARIVPAIEEHVPDIESLQLQKATLSKHEAIPKGTPTPDYHQYHSSKLEGPFIHQVGHHPQQSYKANLLLPSVVNALISSKTNPTPPQIELLPTLSYGFSYSVYPNGKGLYGPGQEEQAKGAYSNHIK